MGIPFDTDAMPRREFIARSGNGVLAAATRDGPVQLAGATLPAVPERVVEVGEQLPEIPAAVTRQLTRLYGNGGLLDQVFRKLTESAHWLSQAPLGKGEGAAAIFLNSAAALWHGYTAEATFILPLLRAEPIQRHLKCLHTLRREQRVALLVNDQSAYRELGAKAKAAERRLCSAFGDPDSPEVQNLVDDLSTEVEICGYRTPEGARLTEYLDLHADIAVDMAASSTRLNLPEESAALLRRELRGVLSEINSTNCSAPRDDEARMWRDLPRGLIRRHGLLKRLHGKGFYREFPRGFEDLF